VKNTFVPSYRLAILIVLPAFEDSLIDVSLMLLSRIFLVFQSLLFFFLDARPPPRRLPQPLPFLFFVRDIDAPLLVEQVTRVLERLRDPAGRFFFGEAEQWAERQPHVLRLIPDRGSTVRAGDFQGSLSLVRVPVRPTLIETGGIKIQVLSQRHEGTTVRQAEEPLVEERECNRRNK